MDLPVELLSEIFLQTTLINPDTPLTLLRTSRTFYRIVHSTPSLWTRLFLDLSQENGDEICTRKAELWFKRAGPAKTINVQIVLIPSDTRPILLPSSTNPAAQAGWISSLSLPRTLALYASQIHSLAVHSCVPAHIQALLDSVYPRTGTDVYPLRSLQITSCQCVAPERGHNLECGDCSSANPQNPSTTGAQATPFRPTTPAATAPLDLPLTALPSLEELDVVHHSVPRPFAMDLNSAPVDGNPPNRLPNLRILRLISPIRFPPVSTQAIFNVLSDTRRTLEHFEFEGRMLDTTTSHNSLQSRSDGHPCLLTLPRLQAFLLRANKLSTLLSHVLTPRLRQLRLDDLDGTRPGGNRGCDLAKAVRGLVVRMEMPFQEDVGEGTDQNKEESAFERSIRGLHSLQLSNVVFNPTRPTNVAHAPSTEGPDETPKIWSWIFRRLRVLEELTTRRVANASDLIDLIMPPSNLDSDSPTTETDQSQSPSSCSQSGVVTNGEALENILALPALRRLNILISGSPVAAILGGEKPLSRRASNRLEVMKFRRARRGVRVRLGVDGEPDDEFIEPFESEVSTAIHRK